ncbi:hypothetical protein [Pseudomonas sp. RW409]|uniref:hypothetical protein n=1 Tax=Pseudomonas sp. RW409 TaxID=2202895 RepID=UPI0011B39377|nr:hypothetical protein [Pseudomonas sp. RW409]
MNIRQVKPKDTVFVVADGGIAHPDIAEGRMIPALILNCEKHQNFCDLVLIHETTPPGDVIVKWGRSILDKKHAFLTLEFQQPVKCTLSIRFTLEKQAGLIDGIIKSRGAYLIPFQFCERVSEALEKPKILIEVPSSATFPGWEKLHREVVLKRYKKNGISGKNAKALANEHLSRVHELWTLRRR